MSEKGKFPLTPVGRISFPSVFKPSAMEEGQALKYSVTLLFSDEVDARFPSQPGKPTQAQKLQAMRDAVDAAIEAKWPGKSKVPGFIKPENLPFHDGLEKPELAGFGAGVTFVRLSSLETHKPHVVGPKKEVLSPADFYGGCYGHATYQCYAWEWKNKKGVSFGLVNVQKLADGEPFAGGTSDPDDDFEDVEADISSALD